MVLETKVPPPLLFILFLGFIYLSRNLIDPFFFDLQANVAKGIVVFGLVFSISGIIQFFGQKTTTNPTTPDKASSLVTTGIFRISRNPMYLGLVMYLIAGAIYWGAFSGLVLIPLFVFYMNKFQIEPEELAMKKLFKSDYEVYCKKVRRWI